MSPPFPHSFLLICKSSFPLQPPLAYLAPELTSAGIGGGDGLLTAAADVFSLAALVYELTTSKQLLPVRSDIYNYRARVTTLAQAELPGIPPELDTILRQMLAIAPGARPQVAVFISTPYFQVQSYVLFFSFCACVCLLYQFPVECTISELRADHLLYLDRHHLHTPSTLPAILTNGSFCRLKHE